MPSLPERTLRSLRQHRERNRFATDLRRLAKNSSCGRMRPATVDTNPVWDCRPTDATLPRGFAGCRVTVVTPGAEKRRNLVVIGQLGCERKCSIEKENLMASPTTIHSPYIHRLELVRDTLKSHSKLGDKEASELAEHVLQALNSIPEKIR